MKRNITYREMILLGLLLVLAVYYFVVQGPIKKQTEELEARRTQLETDLVAIQPKVVEKEKMEEAIDKVFAENPNPTSIPDYDNINKIILQMNAIFASANSYNISFSDATCAENISQRTIKISYVSNSYEDAVNRIQQLHDSDYRYQITDLSVSQSGNGYAVTIVIMDYEYADGCAL